MKFGFSTLGCPGWTLEQVAEAASDYGYEGIELRVLDGEIITPDLIRANQRRIETLFGPGRPRVVGLGASSRFSMADDAARSTNERELIGLIELAAQLQIPLVRAFGGRLNDGDRLDDGVIRVAESLNRCASRASELGITIGLETHDDFSKSATVADVLRRVPSPSVGALWDTQHPFQMGEDIATVWTNLAGRLAHVHLKDARRRSEGAWDLVLLGEGDVPCREIMRALAMRGYDGWVVAEWEKKWHPQIAEPEIALPQHLSKMREWVADLV